jgi:hypothetical protein
MYTQCKHIVLLYTPTLQIDQAFLVQVQQVNFNTPFFQNVSRYGKVKTLMLAYLEKKNEIVYIEVAKEVDEDLPQGTYVYKLASSFPKCEKSSLLLILQHLRWLRKHYVAYDDDLSNDGGADGVGWGGTYKGTKVCVAEILPKVVEYWDGPLRTAKEPEVDRIGCKEADEVCNCFPNAVVCASLLQHAHAHTFSRKNANAQTHPYETKMTCTTEIQDLSCPYPQRHIDTALISLQVRRRHSMHMKYIYV